MTICSTSLEAVCLVRGEAWGKTAVFYTDADKTAHEDLTGKTVTAEIRWRSGEQAVTVAVTDPATGGQVTLSMTADATLEMPLGQIPTLFIAVDDATWAKAPVKVLQGIAD